MAGLRLLDGGTYSSRTTRSRSTRLQDLDHLCDGAEFVVGHNVTAHDLPEIGKRAPELALLRLPAIDTLVLSPIAFPQRPYHRLVKPYKTPGLERLQVNDPLIDAGTTALLLGDICKTLQSADPTRLAAWHWLLTREAASDGYERLFARIRAAPQPEDDEGMAATLKAMDELGWLREWRRDLRREQRGLLLTSAHRAKGLEFDHVVILEGRWRRHQGREDDEATRRLYYVAMTRARLTLTLMRGTGAGNDCKDASGTARRAGIDCVEKTRRT